MRPTTIISSLIMLLATSTGAMADLSGLVGQDTLRFYDANGQSQTDLQNAAYAVIDVYLEYAAENTEGYRNADTSTKAMRNVNISAAGFSDFTQKDITGSPGSWAPQESKDVSPNAISTIDSFVTVGGEVGSGAEKNATYFPLAPWGDLSAPNIFNPNIRWANYNTMQTELDSELRVMVGRFVVTGEEARNGASFSMSGFTSYSYGTNTGTFTAHFENEFVFTPTPGAVALLGIGGASLRRRRA